MQASRIPILFECKPGKENAAANALSWVMEIDQEEDKFEDGSIMSLSTPILDLFTDLQRLNENHEYLYKLKPKTESEPQNYDFHRGCLRFKGKYIIPEDSDLIQKILFELQDSKVGGHFGVDRTWKRISKLFW